MYMSTCLEKRCEQTCGVEVVVGPRVVDVASLVRHEKCRQTHIWHKYNIIILQMDSRYEFKHFSMII